MEKFKANIEIILLHSLWAHFLGKINSESINLLNNIKFNLMLLPVLNG